ncbi:xcpT [Symbiodinium necroappetens]|uniref:XcpT protein n=1 Tax=Symbiodinium necroappetens TaxID=1628268 RepID=A0A812PKV8_9DINO|nr:xcpT [Symbiodinium necroappetens]
MFAHARKAFTLVEILIVVVILGILAAIVVPKFSSASEQSAQTAFVTTLNELVKVANLSYTMSGQYPVEHTFGMMPTEYDTWLDSGEWGTTTPIGGNWDVISGGAVTFGVGVFFPTSPPTDAFMAQIDALYDDGVLTTGAFQKLGTGEFYVIMEP